MTFRKILFPVDFSDRCRSVAPYVHAAARRHGAAVTVAAFVELPMVWYGAAEVPVVPDLDVPHMVEEAQHNLAFFAGEFFGDVPTQVVVQQGDPGTGIVELARQIGTELIMMPTRGQGRFRAALLGSVTAKVLHDTDCPVWTDAHTQSPAYTASPEWRNVVCAVDTTQEAARLIRAAGELSSAYGAAIRLVHAVPSPPEAGPERFFERDFDIFLKDSARKTIESMQAEAGTDFPLAIEAGRISTVVTDAARECEADLVMIGRGELAHLAGRLRTHVYAIIRDVPCPVLSL